MQKQVVIVDIDGTLADVRSSRKVSDITPIEPVIKVIRALAQDHIIIALTARPEESRKWTEKWFLDNNLPIKQTYMMKDEDYYTKQPHVHKRECLEQIEKDHGKIAMAFDDDENNVRMFTQRGIYAFHVGFNM